MFLIQEDTKALVRKALSNGTSLEALNSSLALDTISWEILQLGPFTMAQEGLLEHDQVVRRVEDEQRQRRVRGPRELSGRKLRATLCCVCVTPLAHSLTHTRSDVSCAIDEGEERKG